MSTNIDFSENPFVINNPYKCQIKDTKGNSLSLYKDKILVIADQISNRVKDCIFTDYEKRVNFIGNTMGWVNTASSKTILAIEIPVFASNFFGFHIKNIPVLNTFPFLLNIILVPGYTFLLALTFFQGIVEFLNLRKAHQFLENIRKNQDRPLSVLHWIQERYFTLDQTEKNKIQEYIEQTFPIAPCKDKAEHFDAIAKKALQIKFEGLKRRISPGLAKEVVTQLNILQEELNSADPEKRADGLKRVQVLMDSMTRQAKTKIVIHCLALIALGASAISFSVFLAGIPALILFGVLGTLSFSFVVLYMILDRYGFAKEVEKFYDKLEGLNLRIKENSALSPKTPATP